MTTPFRSALALVLAALLAAAPLGAESVKVTASTVYVRRGPSTATAVVATATRGAVLEVLGREDEWYRVRTSTGVEGYVSGQWLQPSAATAAPAPAARAAAPAASPKPAPPAAAAPAATPADRTGRVAIDHRDVTCVVAGRFPRLDACFAPAESVGRAQVQFRADEKGPWYYVEMKPEGACHSAFLPKPKPDIGSFHYFIEVVDRSFTTVDRPEAAPGQAFAPRVVARDIECGRGAMMATSQPTASVVMGVARDAGGKVIQAAATAQGAPATASISGFSTDGVTMVGGGTPVAEAPESAKGNQSGKGGHGARNLAIGGGVVAAGAVAALAAGGGGGSASGSSGTGGNAPGSSTPSTGTAPGGTTATLTGRWVGLVGNGEGLTYVIGGEGVTCTYQWDLTTDLVQSGSALSGGGTSVARTVNCSVPIPAELIQGTSGSGSLSGTVSGNTLTFRAGEFTFTGTWSGTKLEATTNGTMEGFTFAGTWRQTKQ
jgi:uncharacterized protein YraI